MHARRLTAWRAPLLNARLSVRLARELSLPEESLKVYASIELALREILWALRARDLEQAGVRDLIVIGADQDPSLDRAASAAMGCEVATWKADGAMKFDNFESARALAVVTAMDDRWTGRVFRAPAELKDQREAGQPWSRVPWLRVGFELPRYLNLTASAAYDIQILQAGRNGEALVIAGDRVRLESSFGELVAVDDEAFQDFTLWMRNRDAEKWPDDARLIANFESQLPTPFQAYFADSTVTRLWDRALIWSPNHHASQLIEAFRSAGAREDEVWSWQACVYDDYRLEEWLLRREGNPRLMRGGLQISLAGLRRLKPEFCLELLRSAP
ncbi:MAG TPA: hypothetical protein PLZ57_04225 [Pseudobdellovibrionaceae bacterium]|nr:hypothetical protein [Pseudobdellovibrionaceae bacterium]